MSQLCRRLAQLPWYSQESIDKSYSKSFERAITVITGPAKQKFLIHEGLAKANSEYFKVALDGGWLEAKNSTFELPDENETIFAGFVNFIYNKVVGLTAEEDKEMYLVESYLLGERRGCVTYRNAVISALKTVWTAGKLPTLDAIMLAFRESMEHSKLRRLIVDKCAWEGSAAVLMGEVTVRNSMLPGFGLELSLALLKRVDSAMSASPDPICPSVRQSSNNHHWCQCDIYFREDAAQTCHYSSSGMHTCNNCGTGIDQWQHQVKVPKLALSRRITIQQTILCRISRT